MRTIAIVGGHGKIAQLLARRLVERGDAVLATYRAVDHRAELEAIGASPVLLDIESSDEAAFAAALGGADIVVFSAGAGADGNADRKRTVDLQGSLKAQSAARALGVRRFLQVSAVGVHAPLPEDTDPVWRAYVEAKRDADRALVQSGLAFTVLRPGRLTDDAATGRVRLAPGGLSGAIPRGDVAALLVAALDDDASIGVVADAVSGDEPVDAAWSTLAG